jgi:hypothetical protein
MSLIAQLGMRKDQIRVIFLNGKIVDAEMVLRALVYTAICCANGNKHKAREPRLS